MGGELGRSADRSSEDDRTRETRELWVPPSARDYLAIPMSDKELEAERKVSRGELRWIGGEWVESEPYDRVKRHDRALRMREEVELPPEVRDLPTARDEMPNLHWAEIDKRKFHEYSMNPEHPHNRGKAEGWRTLGYEVDNPDARREAAQDLKDMIYQELLSSGKVATTKDTPFGPTRQVLNGFIGPNDKHATLVTCWIVEDQSERGHPKLTTTWVQPHRERESEQ